MWKILRIHEVDVITKFGAVLRSRPLFRLRVRFRVPNFWLVTAGSAKMACYSNLPRSPHPPKTSAGRHAPKARLYYYSESVGRATATSIFLLNCRQPLATLSMSNVGADMLTCIPPSLFIQTNNHKCQHCNKAIFFWAVTTEDHFILFDIKLYTVWHFSSYL